MKLVLEKPWDWNDQALMYFDCQRPVMTRFPFWWYHVEGRQVRLIKQISKTFGVCFAENRWIEEVEENGDYALNLENIYSHLEYDSNTISELERRSWMTLGQFVIDDYANEFMIEYPSGGGVIFKFHPMTKKIIEVTKCDSDGIIVYYCKIDFEEVVEKETNKKKIYKSKSLVYDNVAAYACMSKKPDDWQENEHGKYVKDWKFYEMENKKLVQKIYRK